LTLVQPVFDEQSPEPSFFVANRAHHADIGGVAPGSMSIDACRLEQEGIVIPPIQIAQANHLVLEELEQLVRCSPFPPRKWEENLADIYAQRAACLRGGELLSEYAATIGWKEMRRYSQHLLEASQARIEHFFANELFERTNLKRNSRVEFSDQLEDGTPICVAISISPSKRLRIDFEGTGSESTTNLNANPSIVSAAVLYVLRCLVADDLPLNEGVLRAVELRIPRSVLNPQVAEPRGQSPAVAAGNVETSQRVVDVLLGALGIAAASQGTMNNLLFGNESFGFYETICGGSGATKSASGASAVHTHMTNTRLTDPEVLELRYPVRLVQFGVRKGSGGHGEHNGGDGVVRSFEFLQPVSLSLLTSRRSQGPFGLVGGKPGACGENWLLSPKKQLTKLPSSCQLSVEAGSILTILTPGGGGFGFNFEL
jgi:5-oxoprolinase (ATP-hydrolysing)